MKRGALDEVNPASRGFWAFFDLEVWGCGVTSGQRCRCMLGMRRWRRSWRRKKDGVFSKHLVDGESLSL